MAEEKFLGYKSLFFSIKLEINTNIAIYIVATNVGYDQWLLQCGNSTEINKAIVKECTHLIAYWNGVSKGTKSSIDMCNRQNKPLRIVQI